MLVYIIKTDHNGFETLPMNFLPLPILSQHSHAIKSWNLSIVGGKSFIKLVDKGIYLWFFFFFPLPSLILPVWFQFAAKVDKAAKTGAGGKALILLIVNISE